MKSLLLSIKNILPYLLLIGIYFFFVNLEARNDLNNSNNNSKSKFKEDNKNRHINNNSSTISIPVIPYEQELIFSILMKKYYISNIFYNIELNKLEVINNYL